MQGFRKMRSSVVAMGLLVLAGCGGGATEEAGRSGDAANKPAAAVAGADAVSAVLQTHGTPVARLQFEIETRPVVGQPFKVRLMASAPQPVPTLQLAAESAELTLENPSTLLVLEEADASVAYELSAVAAHEGLAEIIVKLRAGPDQPEAVYAIPLLVGAPADG